MTRYTVIFERGEKKRSAYVPDLPRYIATAATREELEQLIREAIEFHVEGMRRHGDPVPEPTIEAGLVEVTI